MDFTLEKNKFFPYIAWGVIGCFAIFAYSLTVELNRASDELTAQTHRTMTMLNADTFGEQ